MLGPLAGMRVIEVASFIAAPIGGLHLLQLGADVIRVDPLGGAFDYRRWPKSEAGASFYWEGLNKGKKSVALDLSSGEGRELLLALIASPTAGGILLTNFPKQSFLSHDALASRRDDLITVRVCGWADGRSALDYTVNSQIGLPYMTGPDDLGDVPINHVLPAWDLLAGAQAATAVLAADRHRSRTGKGQEVLVPLGEIALSTMGHLGQIAEVCESGKDRPRYGNDLFGAFGRDFVTRDGRRVMITAITPKQWAGLVTALSIGDDIRGLEKALGVSFDRDEGERFVHRGRLFPIIEARTAEIGFDELSSLFDRHGVCWGPYQSLTKAIERLPSTSTAVLFDEIQHPSGHRYPTPGSALRFENCPTPRPAAAPRLGADTDEVLMDMLGFSQQAVGGLHARGLV